MLEQTHTADLETKTRDFFAAKSCIVLSEGVLLVNTNRNWNDLLEIPRETARGIKAILFRSKPRTIWLFC